MRSLQFIFVFSLFVLIVLYSTRKPESDIDKVSYFTGQQIGQNIKKQGFGLNQKLIAKGIVDAINGEVSLFNPEEMRQAKNKLSEMVSQVAKEAAQVNAKKTHAFLEEKKKNPAWVTTANGLQYRIATAEKGEMPMLKDTVLVHCMGAMLDGQKFESSLDRGIEPMELKANNVVKGWAELMQLMRD